MVTDLQTLPPLNALRAAEVAGRTGSIASAAKELGVTPAAISQQLQSLESFLGLRLFERGRYGVTPTAAGSAVLPHLSEGFSTLARILDIGPDARAPGRIAVSAPASAAFKWLPKIVLELQDADPEQRMDLRIEDDPVHFGEQGPDLRLSYGDLPYAGLTRETLVNDVLVPVCAPGLAREWPARSLIHTDWGPSYASPPSWLEWAARAGVAPPDLRIGHRTSATALSIDMAARGLGVVLVNALYAHHDLAEGRLAVAFGPAIELPAPYTLYYHDKRPQLIQLVARLKALATRDVEEVLGMVAAAGDVRDVAAGEPAWPGR